MSYATPAQFRRYMKQVVSPTAPDPDVQEVLDRANSFLDEVLGFAFLEGEEEWDAPTTKKVRGRGGAYLTLPPFKAGSVVSVVNDFTGETIATSEWEEDGQSLYRVNAQGYEGNWERYRYTVTAQWGYGLVPDSVLELELELAVNMWRSKDAGRFSNVIGVEGSGAVGYEGAMTPLQRKIVAKIKNRYEAWFV